MPEQLKGFREFSQKLKKMGPQAGGKVLRASAMSATLPLKKALAAAAPVGQDVYVGPYSGVSKVTGKPWSKYYVDAYPKKTYKGNVRLPGFTSRNIARKSYISSDKTEVRVRVGVRAEAFAAVNFIEFGTSSIPARPWLEPTFRSMQSVTLSRLGQQLGERIEKAARK